ncbi:MAG: S-methyl-5-thioribose-1-phosphate isomerase [Pseudomonadaceae bacterium]
MLHMDTMAAEQPLQGMVWLAEGKLRLLDQRVLPDQVTAIECGNPAQVLAAMRGGAVRGAAALGIAAAYALALAARRPVAPASWLVALQPLLDELASIQPMAANLQWALGIMRQTIASAGVGDDMAVRLLQAAQAIQAADREANQTMARLGVQLLRRHQAPMHRVMLHGYAGDLSGGGGGTTYGVARAASAAGLVGEVLVNEGRSLAPSAALGVSELVRGGAPAVLHADVEAGRLMKHDGVTWVLVGAERIAANGDVIGPLGSYPLAILAMHHGLRFGVVASTATIDMSLSDGDDLGPDQLGSVPLAGGAGDLSPLEVTPVELIDAIVTEKGIIEQPDERKIASLMSVRQLH